MTRNKPRSRWPVGSPPASLGFDGEQHCFEYRTIGERSGVLASIRTPDGNRIGYVVGPTGLLAAVECSPFRISYQYDDRGRLVGLTQSNLGAVPEGPGRR